MSLDIRQKIQEFIKERPEYLLYEESSILSIMVSEGRISKEDVEKSKSTSAFGYGFETTTADFGLKIEKTGDIDIPLRPKEKIQLPKRFISPKEKQVARSYVAQILFQQALQLYDLYYQTTMNRSFGNEGMMEFQEVGKFLVHELDLGKIGISEPDTRGEIYKIINNFVNDCMKMINCSEEEFEEKFKYYCGKEFDYQKTIEYIESSVNFAKASDSEKLNPESNVVEELKNKDKDFQNLIETDLSKRVEKWCGNTLEYGGLVGLGFDMALLYGTGVFGAISKASAYTGKAMQSAMSSALKNIGMKKSVAPIIEQMAGITSSQLSGAALSSTAFQGTKIIDAMADGKVTQEEGAMLSESAIGLFKFGYVGSAISGPLGMQVAQLTNKMLNSTPIINQVLKSTITNKPMPLTNVLKNLSEHSNAISAVTKFGTEFSINAGYMALEDNLSYGEALESLAKMDAVSKMVAAFIGGKNTAFLTPEKIEQVKTELAGFKVNLTVYKGQKVFTITDKEGKVTHLANENELMMFVADKITTEVSKKEFAKEQEFDNNDSKYRAGFLKFLQRKQELEKMKELSGEAKFLQFLKIYNQKEYNKLQKLPFLLESPEYKELRADFEKLNKLQDTIDDCRMFRGKPKAEILYEDYLQNEYVSQNSKSSEHIKDLCRQINKDFGVKVFLPSNLEEAGVALKLIYQELACYKMHAEANGKNADLPPVLEFFISDAVFVADKSIQGGCASFADKSIQIRGLSVKTIKKYLRHELAHANEQKHLQEFPKGFNPQQYEPIFREANIPDNAIKYGQTSPTEFIATAAQGDMSKYPPQLREALISLGMPEWMFNMPANFTKADIDNVARANIAYAKREANNALTLRLMKEIFGDSKEFAVEMQDEKDYISSNKICEISYIQSALRAQGMSNRDLNKLKKVLEKAEIGFILERKYFRIEKISDKSFKYYFFGVNKKTKYEQPIPENNEKILLPEEKLEYIKSYCKNKDLAKIIDIIRMTEIDDNGLDIIYRCVQKSNSLTLEEIELFSDAIELYKQKTWYKSINKYARGDNFEDLTPMEMQAKQYYKKIEKLFNDLQYFIASTGSKNIKLQTYRRDGYSILENIFFNLNGANLSLSQILKYNMVESQTLNNLIFGKKIFVKSFLSTSLTETGANSCGRVTYPILWKFTTDGKYSGIYIDAYLNNWSSEMEFLFQTNTTIEINSINFKNDSWVIDAKISS